MIGAPLLEPRIDSWGYWTSRVVGVLVGAMLLYLGLTIWAGVDQLGQALSNFPLATRLPLILALVCLGLFLRGLRWRYYVLYLAWPIPFWPSITAFMASFALTATPGKAGEVVKAGLLRSRYNIPMADTTGVLLVERLEDLLAVMILAAGGLTLLANAWLYFIICLAAVAGITVFVTQEKLHRSFFAQLARFPRLKPGVDKALELLETGQRLLRPAPFINGLAIAIIAWSCEAWAFHWILGGFGIGLPFLTSFSIYGLSTIIGALSMLPGGIGGVEAVMLLLLTTLGINPTAAVAPVVLVRFSTLWFGSLLGFVFMGGWLLTHDLGGR